LSNLRVSNRYQNPDLRLLAAILCGDQPPQEVPPDRWGVMIDTAAVHSLLPMLLWTVKRAAPELVAGRAWEQVLTAARNSAVRHVWHEHAQAQVNQALSAAGIPVVWLKGIALAQTVFPQPALRPMGDIDALVPYEQREAALELVRALGFEFYEYPKFTASVTHKVEQHQDHHYRLRGGINDSVFIELHYRIINDGRAVFPLQKEQWFLTQIDTSIDTLPMLKPEAFLLHLCAHAVLHHGEDETLLSQYFDIHRLLINKPIDWSLLIDQAVNFRWSYAVEYAFLVTRTLFNSPIPDDVFTQLQARRPRDENAARIFGLQGHGANLQLVLGMLRGLSFGQKVRLLWDFAFPPPGYMRARYKVSPRVPIWVYYPRRWLHQAGVILAWVWRRMTQIELFRRH